MLHCQRGHHNVHAGSLSRGSPFRYETQPRCEDAAGVVSVESVYGVIDMEVNSYVVVVTKATQVATIRGKKVFRADMFQLICLAPQ